MLKLASVICVVLSLLFVIFRKRDGHCLKNEFRLKSMIECHSLLTCNDIKDIELHELIGHGAVKNVYRAIWKNNTIAVSYLRDKKYESDFWHGLRMLRKYSHSPLIVKLIGFCKNKNLIMTEYHKNGDGFKILEKINKKTDNVSVRLKLCLNYVKILEMLHNATAITTVNCDSNDLGKTLSQLLITDDLTLILNDVDSLAEMKNSKLIKCGKREIFGDFVAPEQLWNSTKPFNDEEMKEYDEKTDIWKAATLCNYFLGDVVNAITVRYRLFDLHSKCKSVDPSERPNAKDLVREYSRVLSELDGDWL